MLIKVSGSSRGSSAPNDLSDYVRTYNHAIDIVTQAVGWANKVSTRQVAAIKLKPMAYRNFEEGIKLLLKQQGGSGEIEPGTQLTWEGYPIIQGSRSQVDTVIHEYVENAVNHKLHS